MNATQNQPLKIANILKGILSGYLLKGVQLILSIVIVPFLLDPKVLGLESFGLAQALIAINGFFSIFTDGWRISQSREIARHIDSDPHSVSNVFGGCIKLSIIFSTIVLVSFIVFKSSILRLSNIHLVGFQSFSLILVGFIFFFDQSFAINEAAIHAIGRTSTVNAILGIESLTRNVAMLVMFSFIKASIFMYILLFLIGIIFKHASYISILAKYDFFSMKAIRASSIKTGFETLKAGLTISIGSLNLLLIPRASVLITNFHFGAEAAGIIAIIVNTITSYANQLFFSIIRPMLVPMMSRYRIQDATDKEKRLFYDASQVYSFLNILVIFVLIAFSPVLLSLWLGPSYNAMIFPTQIMLFGLSYSISVSIKRSFIISAGYETKLMFASLPLCLFFFVLMVFSNYFEIGWQAVIFIVALNNFLSGGIVVDILFSRMKTWELIKKIRNGFHNNILALIACWFIAYFLSRHVILNKPLQSFISLLSSAFLVSIVCHFLLIKASEALTFFRNINFMVLNEIKKNRRHY